MSIKIQYASDLHIEFPENKEFLNEHPLKPTPTFMNYPELYKADILNVAFAVELYDMIVTSNIDSWVYGHLHSNTPEFTIGKNTLFTSQLGYVKLGEHSLFETTKYTVL